MIEELIRVLTLMTAVGAGLMAGFFFAFSTCVMKALARLPPAQGIAAMQSINVTVINPVFLSAFFGTAVACAILTIFSLLAWQRPGSHFLLVGSLLYLFGTILVTMLCNVPRNERLAAVEPTSTEGSRLWIDYANEWTAWNHVRTAASIVAATALILALRL
jgi:uncharacterized membrane protein